MSLRSILFTFVFGLLAWGRVSAAAALTTFDVPAGPAEQRVLQLSEQAGVQILFATDVVADVSTNAVQGKFSARAALEKLLAGTPLVVVADDGTGTLAVRRAEAAAEAVVLPP